MPDDAASDVSARRQYRVIVTGSRDWADRNAVYAALDAVLAEHPRLIVVQGLCPYGADAQAVSWVMDRWTFAEADVTHEDHPADWATYGKRAGPVRNEEMVRLGADVVLAFVMPCSKPSHNRWKPHDSHGTADCVARAEAAGIPVERIRPNDQ